MSSLRSAECWPWGSAVGWAWIPDPTPPGPGLPDSRPLSCFTATEIQIPPALIPPALIPASADPACARPHGGRLLVEPPRALNENLAVPFIWGLHHV